MKKQKTGHVRNHAIQRAWERYGVRLDRKNIKELNGEIRSGVAVELYRKGDTGVVYEVTFQERTMLALFDTDRDTIVTFLPIW